MRNQAPSRRKACSICNEKVVPRTAHPSRGCLETSCIRQFARDARRAEGKIEIRNAPPLGKGVFATRGFEMGDVLGEYIGKLLPTDSAPDESDMYQYTCDGVAVITAKELGNWTRFINHDCEPNVEVDDNHYGGRRALIFTANRDIAPGEQLAIDYGVDYFINANIRCRCPLYGGVAHIPGQEPQDEEAPRAQLRTGLMARKTGMASTIAEIVRKNRRNRVRDTIVVRTSPQARVEDVMAQVGDELLNRATKQRDSNRVRKLGRVDVTRYRGSARTPTTPVTPNVGLTGHLGSARRSSQDSSSNPNVSMTGYRGSMRIPMNQRNANLRTQPAPPLPPPHSQQPIEQDPDDEKMYDIMAQVGTQLVNSAHQRQNLDPNVGMTGYRGSARTPITRRGPGRFGTRRAEPARLPRLTEYGTPDEDNEPEPVIVRPGGFRRENWPVIANDEDGDEDEEEMYDDEYNFW